jgi:geranylgeranylglycerol-phosphate geranylgeranyltransferase
MSTMSSQPVSPRSDLSIRLRAYWEMLRVGTPAAAMALTFVGVTIGGPRYPALILAMAAPACVVGAANLYNDCCDQVADRVNRPDRPLPIGRVSVKGVYRLITAMAVGGVLVASPLGTYAVATTGVLLAGALSYSRLLRRAAVAGPMTVAVLFATPVLYGGYFASARVQPAHWLAAAQVAIFVFARETLKSIPDREGDAAAGYHTLATDLGEAGALHVFRIGTVVFVIAALLPFPTVFSVIDYLSAIALFGITPMAIANWHLRHGPTPGAVQSALGVTGLVFAGGMVPLLLLAR